MNRAETRESPFGLRGVAAGDIWRLILGVGLLLSLGVVAWSTVNDFARDKVLAIAGDRIHVMAAAREKAIELHLRGFERVLQGLGYSPSLSALSTNTPDAAPVDVRLRNRDAIERWFMSLMDTENLLRQLRIIGADNGRELIRVERRDGRAYAVRGEALQDKSDRDYVRETLALPAMATRLSEIELNRERGELETPVWPTLRASMPLFDAQGKVFGMVVINYDASSLISPPANTDALKLRYHVLNGDGEFLTHPDPTMAFAFEYGASRRWDDLYPAAVDSVWHRSSDESNSDLTAYEMDGEIVVGTHKSVRLAQSGDTYVDLAITTSPSWLDTSLVEYRRKYAIAAVSIWLLCLAFFSYLLWEVYRKHRLVLENRNYRALVGQNMSGVMAVDPGSRVLFCNPAGLRILGLTSDELIGRDLFSVVSPLDAKMAPEGWFRRLCELEGTTLDLFLKVDSRQLELAANITHVDGDGANQDFFAMVFTDNSQKMALRRKEHTAKEELERLVAERTEDLERSRNLAMSSNQIKTEFIANLSHELRTPLHGIFGTLRLLRQDRLNERQRHRLALAEESMAELTEVVNSILDVSKLEADKLDIQETDLSLPALINEVAKRCAVKAKAKGLPIYVDSLQVSDQLVYGDHARITRIIANLLDNAVRVTKAGDIRLVAKTSPRGEHELLFECEVSDTGPGIPEDVRAQVFEGFYSADQLPVRAIGGTGLGLPVAQQLCRLMGGDLQILASCETGATLCFQLRLALVGGEQAPSGVEFNPLLAAEVLIALPAPAAREVAAKLVQDRGARALPVENLEAALPEQWLRASHVIVDLETYLEKASVLLDWLTRKGGGKTSRVLVSSEVSEHAMAVREELPSGVVLLEEPLTRISIESALLVGEGSLFDQRKRAGEISDAEHTHIWKVLPSLAVLVVDDNRVNQRVLGALLEEYGAFVSYAADGQEALDMLKKRGSDPFDLILMDCQMPVMNGYEATQRIRAGAVGEEYVKTPVIAVTAGAMGGDRLKCIESGMNDYLTKPIAQNALELAIANAFKVAPGDQAASESIARDTDDLSEEVRRELRKLPDWDMDDVKRRFMGKMEIVSTLVDLYLKVAPELLGRVDEALEHENYRDLRNVAHEIKGMAKNLGVRKIAYLSYEVEMAALDRRLQDIVFLVAKLKLSSGTVQKILEDHEAAVD